MGYSHYWDIKRPLTDDEFAAIAEDIKAIVLASDIPIAGWDGYGKPEYGSGPFGRRIALNGAEPDDHETFQIKPDGGWDCCKTQGDLYDAVVTASLLAIKDRLGPDVRLASDGEVGDWIPGHQLAERALNRRMPVYEYEEGM